MSEILVFATLPQAATVRGLLARACTATGVTARLELFGSGSLFQRLRARRSPPPPDLIVWFGPYAAHAAALEGLLQPYQPPNLPDQAMHDPGWRWVAVDHQPFTVTSRIQLSAFDDLAQVPRISMPDPERSEVGMQCALAVLDRFRQMTGDVEQGWTWWQRRVQAGVLVTEDDAGALAALERQQVSHALTLQPVGTPLAGLPPVPHAISVSASARDADAARLVVNWLVGAAPVASSGLRALLNAAPSLDVDWATRQYVAVRQRWARSGFGPNTSSP